MTNETSGPGKNPDGYDSFMELLEASSIPDKDKLRLVTQAAIEYGLDPAEEAAYAQHAIWKKEHGEAAPDLATTERPGLGQNTGKSPDRFAEMLEHTRLGEEARRRQGETSTHPEAAYGLSTPTTLYTAPVRRSYPSSDRLSQIDPELAELYRELRAEEAAKHPAPSPAELARREAELRKWQAENALRQAEIAQRQRREQQASRDLPALARTIAMSAASRNLPPDTTLVRKFRKGLFASHEVEQPIAQGWKIQEHGSTCNTRIVHTRDSRFEDEGKGTEFSDMIRLGALLRQDGALIMYSSPYYELGANRTVAGRYDQPTIYQVTGNTPPTMPNNQPGKVPTTVYAYGINSAQVQYDLLQFAIRKNLSI